MAGIALCDELSQGPPLTTGTTYRSLAHVLGELVLVVIAAGDVGRARQVLLILAHGVEYPAPLVALVL